MQFEIDPNTPRTVTVGADETLTLTADGVSRATVWQTGGGRSAAQRVGDVLPGEVGTWLGEATYWIQAEHGRVRGEVLPITPEPEAVTTESMKRFTAVQSAIACYAAGEPVRIGDATLTEITAAEAPIAPESPATPHRKESRMKLPNISGVGPAMAKLRHGLEARAEKLTARITETDARGAAVFDKAHVHLDAAEASLAEVNADLDALEAATNGGPTLAESGTS